jgi:hypothetical protein
MAGKLQVSTPTNTGKSQPVRAGEMEAFVMPRSRGFNEALKARAELCGAGNLDKLIVKTPGQAAKFENRLLSVRLSLPAEKW